MLTLFAAEAQDHHKKGVLDMMLYSHIIHIHLHA